MALPAFDVKTAIIFLDIDGVIVACPEGEPPSMAFTPRCVYPLKAIISAVPHARVVFSSTWRLPQHVDRLHEQWVASGLPLEIAIDGPPDTRTDESVSRLHRRGIEIRRWLEANPSVSRWVVLDDDREGIVGVIGEERCVFTNPHRGLTENHGEQAVEILLRSVSTRSAGM